MNKQSILFVCMGNICRSPTAEGVFRDKVKKAGLDAILHIDSAGTHDYHIEKKPDERAQAAAHKRGYDLSGLRARQICAADFENFDYILAMDTDNLSLLLKQCPSQFQHKVRRFLAFSQRYPNGDVPDPYYGGQDGFNNVLDRIEDGADGLVDAIKRGEK